MCSKVTGLEELPLKPGEIVLVCLFLIQYFVLLFIVTTEVIEVLLNSNINQMVLGKRKENLKPFEPRQKFCFSSYK